VLWRELRRSFWFGFWPKLQVGLRGGRLFAVEHANDEDGIACADFVAVGEKCFFDAGAIQESAIAALQVEDAATFFTVVDGKVEAGHEFVVGEGVIGFGVATEAERHAGA
jgi:hypothetical protein